MITLITGTPGAGKTLFTINELKDIKDKTIYYQRITGLKLNWKKLEDSDLKKWWELPKNSIVVLDEAQFNFPVRGATKKPPEYIEKLTVHRHSGIDFYIITQNAKLLDVFVRRLIGRHYHYKRQFGYESSTRYQWEELADTDDRKAYSLAQKKRLSFPKDTYDLYKSAEVHTVKKQIPPKLFLMLFLIFVVVFLLYFVFAYLGGDNTQIQEELQQDINSQLAFNVPRETSFNNQEIIHDNNPSPKIYRGNLLNHSLLNAEYVYFQGGIILSGKENTTYRFYTQNTVSTYTTEALKRFGFKINKITNCLHKLSYEHITYLTECNLEVIEDIRT